MSSKKKKIKRVEICRRGRRKGGFWRGFMNLRNKGVSDDTYRNSRLFSGDETDAR